jgi:hypothetical protein
MLGKVLTRKYLDPCIPIVNVHIGNSLIQNTLIDLQVVINVMTKEPMVKIKPPMNIETNSYCPLDG